MNLQQQIRKALKFCDNSKFPEAIPILSKVIKKYPNQIEALTILGTIYLNQKHIELGIKYLKKSLSVNPHQSHTLNNIGNAYYNLEDYKAAISCFEKAIAINPNDFNPYYNMGRSFDAIDEHTKAISCFERGIKINPNYSALKANIAISLKKNNEHKKAISYLEEAIKVDANDHKLYLLLAQILEDINEFDEAIRCYKEVLKNDPNSIKAMEKIVIASVNSNIGDIEKEILEKLLFLDPENIEGNKAKAIILSQLGNFEEAITLFRKLLKINPSRSPAYYHDISTIQNLKDDPSFENELRKIISNEETEAFEQPHALYFALGKTLRDQKKYKESFHYFSIGRSLIKKISKDNLEHEIKDLSNMYEKFNQSYIDKLAPFQSSSDLPIFIIGMPRSGTTLTENILVSNNSSVGGAGEVSFWFGAKDLSEFESNIFEKRYSSIAEKYINVLRMKTGKNKSLIRIIDKMPQNFLSLGVIASIFPNAKIIHCNRNPLDICLSIYTTLLNQEVHHYANNLKDLANYYVKYCRLMKYWESIFPDKIFNINYEDLICDNKISVERLFNHLGLEIENDKKNDSLEIQKVKTASIWQVRQPLFRSSIDKFKNYKKELEPLIEIFEKHPDLIDLS